MRVPFDGGEFDARNTRVVVILAHAELPVLHDVAGHTVDKTALSLREPRRVYTPGLLEHQRPVANIDGAVAIIRRAMIMFCPPFTTATIRSSTSRSFLARRQNPATLQDIRRRPPITSIHFRMGVAPACRYSRDNDRWFSCAPCQLSQR